MESIVISVMPDATATVSEGLNSVESCPDRKLSATQGRVSEGLNSVERRAAIKSLAHVALCFRRTK